MYSSCFRDKMEALYHLMPNLPSEVLPYGVQIIEYGPTSTVIKFEGPPAGIENAHKRVSTLVTNLCCEYVPMQHDYQMTELEKLRKTILSKQYGSKVFVSISPDLVLRHIPIWSLDRSILKIAVPEIIQLMSVSCSKLDCSSEEAIYIKHFCRVPRLSLKVEFNEDGILLKGIPEEVDQLKAFLQSTVLNGLLSKKYSFSCKIKFKDHIEQSLLQPYSVEEQSFKYLTLMAGKEKSHKKHTQAKRDGGSNFDVYFYCTNKEFFVKVCCVFDRVSPSSKPYSITQEGMEKVVTDMKSSLENKYHIRLSQNSKSSCFIIDALIPADLQSCLDDIREQVGQKVVTTKYINISHSLYLLLKLYKDDIADLKKSCEITCLSNGAVRENCAIRLKGFISQVDEVHSSLLVLDLNVVEDSFVLHCPAYLFGMWMRRWNQVKEQEEKTKTFVSFSKQASDKEDSMLPVNFQIIGVSETCVQEVKTAIMSEGVETEEKVFSLTPSGVNCFLTVLKDNKLGEITKDIVYVKQIDRQHNKVTLISPKELSECLETAEEQVRKFVGERASTSYVLCSKDPVVNLILSNSTKSMEFIAYANFISRPHQVSVIMQKKPVGLRLSGTEASLSIVKPLMQSVILEGIEKTIGETKVPVKPIYVPLLKSPEFLQFEAKLGSDLCVTCSYPKPGRSSKLVSSSELATDTSGQVVKVDICKGDLVYEQVDVIVNAANEDLKHIGGLAKAILDAGGPSIQKDSDDYTTIHKKVKPGTAVCLGSGDLPCKKIVHAVGPRWAGGKQGEEQLLYFSIFESLKVASTEPVTSIAFPAIGTGVFGVPEDVCARMSLKAVRDFFQSQYQTTIMYVKFVLYSHSTVTAFQSALQSELCGDYQLQSKHGIKPAPPSALPSQSSSVCSWQWTNDQGGFSPYSSMYCTRLEAAYKSNPKGSFQIIINGNNYVIDFQRMVQINSQTGVVRTINNPSLLSSGSSDIQWLYKEGRQYLPYTPQQSASIENMYQDGTSGQLLINGIAYIVDPVQMCQTNSVTKFKRNIRRQVTDIAPSAALKSETSPEVVSEISSLSVPSRLNSDGGGSINEGRSANEDIIITLKGPHDCLHTAEDRLRGKFKKSLSKLCFDKFPKRVTADLDKKLGQIASRNSVSWSFDDLKSSDGKGQRVMNLEGVYFKCKSALEAIQDEVLTFHVLSASSEDDISFPQEWQQQSKTTEVFPLQQGSSEWTRVCTKFSSTMSGNQIVEISRIQNKWLWEKYASHKKRLDRKNSGVVNEMELFHGTRSNDPINIYEGEEGFDMRFSAQGMWGMANYFAANASYSNGYSYQSTKGRQMFLVKVLTGDSYQCPSSRALRIPPVKTAGTSGKEVQFAQTRYDTVTGHTNGSQVFMTYDNDKAYPAYLITYN